MVKRVIYFLLLAYISVGITGCVSNKLASDFTLTTEIIASNDINLDSEGKASPVSFIIYQLKDNESFIAADYDSLILEPKPPFSDAIVSKKQYQIQPGKRASLKVVVSPETKFIGVAGSFREAKVSGEKNWASIVELKSRNSKKAKKLQSKIFLSGKKIDVVIVKAGRLSFN